MSEGERRGNYWGTESISDDLKSQRGIIMTVIMFSGCSTTVQNLAIGEEKTLETGKTEQESVTEKDINMNEKESFNAESNIKNVIHTGHLSAWRWLSVLS